MNDDNICPGCMKNRRELMECNGCSNFRCEENCLKSCGECDSCFCEECFKNFKEEGICNSCNSKTEESSSSSSEEEESSESSLSSSEEESEEEEEDKMEESKGVEEHEEHEFIRCGMPDCSTMIDKTNYDSNCPIIDGVYVGCLARDNCSPIKFKGCSEHFEGRHLGIGCLFRREWGDHNDIQGNIFCLEHERMLSKLQKGEGVSKFEARRCGKCKKTYDSICDDCWKYLDSYNGEGEPFIPPPSTFCGHKCVCMIEGRVDLSPWNGYGYGPFSPPPNPWNRYGPLSPPPNYNGDYLPSTPGRAPSTREYEGSSDIIRVPKYDELPGYEEHKNMIHEDYGSLINSSGFKEALAKDSDLKKSLIKLLGVDKKIKKRRSRSKSKSKERQSKNTKTNPIVLD